MQGSSTQELIFMALDTVLRHEISRKSFGNEAEPKMFVLSL
jgi:hypothetical protein